MKPRVLIIEDEADMREGIRFNLEDDGYQVDMAGDGLEGLERARQGELDLILLDVMLPGMSGIEVLQTLREEGIGVPIVLLTAKGLETDKVRGLKLGADDYVTKPFSIRELSARIEAILRRSERATPAPGGAADFCFADVVVDFGARSVTKAGELVALSYKEYELLKLLIERAGQIVTRNDLLDLVWGYDEAQMPSTRTVDTHIANLRRKLEGQGGRGRYLRTVHKVGYRFSVDPD